MTVENSDSVAKFCDIILKRSSEHREAMALLRRSNCHGVRLTVIRQELDSMIRVIYLTQIDNINERNRLMGETLSGDSDNKWTILTEKGKYRKITDKEMVDLSDKLNGWTLSVYKFGCSFIHLSKSHSYNTSC
ncbi:MAG: hypothetical protein WCJ49_05815, partial [Deltaproteobacteria bacterium]